MINLALELMDKDIKGADFSTPEKGNPGVGGSEYLFLLLGYYLKNTYSNYNITIFHYNVNKLPDGINDNIVANEIELIEKASELDDCILIHQINKSADWYNRIANTDIKDIAWAHCYIGYSEAALIAQNDNVKRVVFVGKEEYDSYIDDDVIKKADYVFNMINTASIAIRRGENYEKSVTYMGSLVEGKAFHLLAEIWPKILKRVPDAKLNVIGSGKLYNRNAKLGKYEIADENYEKKFMPYLTDQNGDILSSVHFYGLMKEGREEIFINSAVGVVNPAGKDETFCLSAIEMELCGLPVVSIRKYGLCDTIIHNQTGLLYRRKKQFADYIIKLLTDNTLNKNLGKNGPEFVTKNFDANKVIKEWNRVLLDVIYERKATYNKPAANFWNDYKLLKISMRIIRINLNIRFIPSVLNIKYIVKKLKK